ncbi:MAG: zinc-ribbon and DUF3426 domain-containing protein [Gammaproteobacteria bacterium]
MVTQCPICRQWFHIAREQTETAHGLVRCGECDTVFNVLATLRESPPPVLTQADEEAIDAEPESAEMADSALSLDEHEELPLPGEWSAQPRRAMRWMWAAALAIAVLVLAAQLVNANRYAIARTPVAGKALKTIYRRLGVPLQARLFLSRYAITDVSLSGTRGASGALSLRGRLVNHADFAQRFPLMRLMLRNRQDETVAERLLLPSNYGATTISTLGAGHGFRFRVLVADPGAATTGFSLVLCKRRGERVVCAPT